MVVGDEKLIVSNDELTDLDGSRAPIDATQAWRRETLVLRIDVVRKGWPSQIDLSPGGLGRIFFGFITCMEALGLWQGSYLKLLVL